MPDYTPIKDMRRDELLHRSIKCGQIAAKMMERDAMVSARLWLERCKAYADLAKDAHR